MRPFLLLSAVLLLSAASSACGEPIYLCDQRGEHPAIPAWDPQTLPQLYNPAENPFDQPIAADPVIHADSATMVRALEKDFADKGLTVGVEQWTEPVYLADASTPRQDIKLRAGWSPYKRMLDVPIPPEARPDPSYDGEMVVLDLDAGVEYDFWQYCHDPEASYASWVNLLEFGGDGFFPTGMGTRAAGSAALNGIIWPYELAAGAIEHALAFSFNLTRAGGPVAPATADDGTTRGDESIPEGARVQLDPALDVSTLGLSPAQETIARAMQVYGMYLIDDGGGIQLYAVNPQSLSDPDPYGAFFTLDAEGLAPFPESFPVDRFRVLDFGPQDPEATGNGHVLHPERYE